MSDTQIQPGSTTAPPAPASTEPPLSNADFARQRLAAEEANKRAQAAEQRLAELEAKEKERANAELSEIERLKKENAELAPLRDEHGRFTGVLQKLYDEELASVPEEKKEQVQKLSASGSLETRLEQIRAAKALLSVPPTPAGSVTNPPSGAAPNGSNTPPTPRDPRDIPWSEAYNTNVSTFSEVEKKIAERREAARRARAGQS